MSGETSRRVQLVTALVLLATFVLGGLSGAAVDRLFARRPPPPPPGAPLLPPGLLDLSASQRAAVGAIEEKHRPALEAIVEASFPKVRAIEVEMHREIREVLTPSQRQKLDAFVARHGPPPGPGVNPRPPPPPR